MAIEVLVLKETAKGERRVAATPETVKKLVATGANIKVESGAGLGAGFVDQAYLDAGAQLATAVTAAQADLVLCVQPPANAELATMKPGAVLIGLLAPHADAARVDALAAGKITAFP
ncbi:MAG: NAD(P)(+) transhydrogenase (Re/Si-specific) subunit alpha, partial [Pseudoxanthomonas sp.]